MIRIPPITGEMVRLRQANAETRGEPLTEVPIDVELAVLEQYPPTLRRMFNEAATKVNCLAFVEHFNWAVRNGYGSERTERKLAQMEANEIEVFAGQYAARYRHFLPHVAAQATVQRYGEVGPSRHPPRAVRPLIFRPQTRKRRFRKYVPAVVGMAA